MSPEQSLQPSRSKSTSTLSASLRQRNDVVNVICCTPISHSLTVSSSACPLRVATRQSVMTTPVSIWNKRLVCWPRLGQTADRLRYWLGPDAKPSLGGGEDLDTLVGEDRP